MHIHLLSENTVLVLTEQIITQENFQDILRLQNLVKKALSEYLVDLIPSYASLHITFDLLKISPRNFIEQLQQLLPKVEANTELNTATKVIEVPVYYGKTVGLDIEELASHAGLSVDDVIGIHSQKLYNVFSIGFAPGFAFLGSVDKSIAMPRKATPRTKVPKGSLGIADTQTAVYPLESPGGWQIIGRTPMQLIDFSKTPITPLAIGDQVKFKPITEKEFCNLGGVI